MGRYEIEVIDLAEHPELARSNDILAEPTLVRLLPSPFRTVIGDLSNADSVVIGLRLGRDPLRRAMSPRGRRHP